MEGDAEVQAMLGRYTEFRLCREMGWTLETLRAQPADVVQEWLAFMSAEGEAKEWLMKDAERKAKGQTGGE